MFQYDIKLLCNLYTSAGYIFKNLQILINNVLVSCTTAATFRMTKDGEEYMFDFYKWPISENDFAKLRILAAIFKENRLHRKTKVSRESRKLIKIVHFREIFYKAIWNVAFTACQEIGTLLCFLIKFIWK